MNQYREQILQAQKTAAIVNLLKKNNYLTAVGANDVLIDHENTFVPVIRHWYRIEGFRAKADEQATKAAVSRAAYGWLSWRTFKLLCICNGSCQRRSQSILWNG